ncbi:unnamed protein product [Acanthoscelides obtectus]|uniref:Bestrophin homolog n=1 Tax=Acanthoscelides obtectus TaxID=200917 RepID=A0A9P0P2U8_ACAOB|nr:unnamed protein product [Acanthoscelides obtectus]CAK1622663.1 Bestrophin-2 [Acanthoscelides obtectus]
MYLYHEFINRTRWRGSIYKLVWMDLILFLTIYYSLNITYRYILDESGKQVFESMVIYCKDYVNLIPLSFVLGFYVSVIMTRWWNQYTSIPHPDPLAVFVSATIHGQDERGRVMRRTIMRYVCCCVAMIFTMISPRVKKRFPTLDHFVEAGMLQQSERDIIADLDKKFPKYPKHWLPIVWASSIVTRARKEGRIRDDFAVKTLVDELNKFRGQCGILLQYDHINIPLVYTQVVTLAVYSYFITNIIGHQWVEDNKYKMDLYFPIFTTLEFFFYIGWLKVAESMINPFGDDDDDFEVNWMVDRNLQVSYLIVDEMHHEHPQLVRDQYWDEVFPAELPYTAESKPFKDTHPLPSTANIAVNKAKPDQDLVGPGLMMNSNMSKGDDNIMNSAYSAFESGPITFSATPDQGGNYMRSRASQSSMGTSVPDSISRVNSVTNMLKRFFSREDNRQDSKMEANELNNLLPNPDTVLKPELIKKITDEVIEEVDEQTTLTSQRSAKECHPTVESIFGPPPPTQPISVPSSSIHKTSSYANAIADVYEPFPKMSESAPNETTKNIRDSMDSTDRVSIGGSITDDEDDFEKLKKMRGEERKQLHKLARSHSNKSDELGAASPTRRRSSETQSPEYPPQPPFELNI